jgi:hypothetical protein
MRGRVIGRGLFRRLVFSCSGGGLVGIGLGLGLVFGVLGMASELVLRFFDGW